MAGNTPDGLPDDFFDQIMASAPTYGPGVFAGSEGNLAGPGSVGLQLGSCSNGGGGGSGHVSSRYRGMGPMNLPLGLNLEQQGFLKSEESCGEQHFGEDMVDANATSTGLTDGVSVHLASLFPGFAQLQSPSVRPPAPPPMPLQIQQAFNDQQSQMGGVSLVQNNPQVRPRVRARRGQATDPHSIAERLRRERIAERMKALQELVPSANKTDRAAMLDEIVDYVKFLRLQVKVLSTSRLGGAGTVAQLVADVPTAIEGGGGFEEAWEKWSDEGTEQQVAKLMEEDIGAAMQFLQSKALCIMPMSLASAIFQTHQSDDLPANKPDSG